jgi:hypothetical protein
MTPIKVPERYNYMACFLTLRCGLGCSYCINEDKDQLETRMREEMSADEWVESINRLETKDLGVTLEGGEPTIHKGFYDIINGIKPEIKIDLLTHLQINIDEFINRVDPEKFSRRDIPGYRSIRASYHVGRVKPEKLINNAVRLQDAGFKIGIFTIGIPENSTANMEMNELATENRILFWPKDYLGLDGNGKLHGNYKYPEALSGVASDVECRTKELLISPTGDIYRCHRDLYAADGAIGSIRDDDFQIRDEFRFCDKYGLCNPCDIKLKTNRFLDMGSHSVEIRDVGTGYIPAFVEKENSLSLNVMGGNGNGE